MTARSFASPPAPPASSCGAAWQPGLGITHVHLSISHDGGLATAFVVCEA